MNYQDALDWLYSTQNFGIKLGLDAPRKLLRQSLAFPDYGVKVVHVAGTNGKGSTCAMLDALGRDSGVKVGLFTSPHLVHFRERIRVAGEMISEENTARLLTDLRELVSGWPNHPTFFELTLAVAMKHFRNQGCEMLVLETGMGGRYDATTVVPADVCVLTPIGMDHSEWLGENLEEIAGEKAAIIVEGKPVIAAHQHPEALGVIMEVANEKRAPLEIIEGPLLGYTVNLAGEHQRQNAHLAVSAAHALGLDLKYDTVKSALESVSWPGRFEKLWEYEHKRSDCEVVLDGAHNLQAAEVLVNTWKAEYPGVRPTIIFGAVQSKDVGGVLGKLTEIAETIILCPIENPRTHTAAELEAFLPDQWQNVELAGSLEDAWALAKGQYLLVAGSLFLIGQCKAALEQSDFETSSQ